MKHMIKVYLHAECESCASRPETMKSRRVEVEAKAWECMAARDRALASEGSVIEVCGLCGCVDAHAPTCGLGG